MTKRANREMMTTKKYFNPRATRKMKNELITEDSVIPFVGAKKKCAKKLTKKMKLVFSYELDNIG